MLLPLAFRGRESSYILGDGCPSDMLLFSGDNDTEAPEGPVSCLGNGLMAGPEIGLLSKERSVSRKQSICYACTSM